MSDELSQGEGDEGAGLPRSAGQVPNDNAGFPPAATSAPSAGPGGQQEATDPAHPCPSEAQGEAESVGSTGTLPAMGVEGSQPEAIEMDAPFTPTGQSAIEKLADAFAIASHEDFLGRGDDLWRWDPEPDYYEPPPTADLIRRDGSISMACVKWKGPCPSLTTSTQGFTYKGTNYDVPSLPAAIESWLLLPSGVMPSDSARVVFDDVYEVLEHCSFLSEDQCELLTFWCMDTWFSDRLDFVPKLSITGPRHAADLLFEMMRYVCRRALLLAGIKPAVLKQIPIGELKPTLLIQLTTPSKSASELLEVSDYPGYFVSCGGELRQFHCPRAVYFGEDYDPKKAGNGLYIHLSRSAPVTLRPFLSNSALTRLQNELFSYRCRNLDRLEFVELPPGELLPHLDVIARRLGAVVVDDPTLQSRVAEILRLHSEQIHADRAGGIEGIVVQSILRLAHRDELQAYVRDIATAAIQISIEQGESLKLSSEKVGHVLKRIGLYTRSLGSGGRGLVFDKATQLRAHRLAMEYGLLPSVSECGYCHHLQVLGDSPDAQ